MRKIIPLLTGFAFVMTLGYVGLACKSRRGYLEYDDARTGLHVRAPDGWVIVLRDDCPEDAPACWYVMLPDTGANIRMIKRSRFSDPGEGTTPGEAMRAARQGIVNDIRTTPETITGISDVVDAEDGSYSRFSADRLTDRGFYRLHFASARSPTDPDVEFLFVAGSELMHAEKVDRAFASFLVTLGPIPAR